MELFMNTMKMKNIFCKGHQYEMQKSQDAGGNNAFKIFSSWGKKQNIPSTISYMELFMTPMKMKNISTIDARMKGKKARMEVAIIPIKLLCAGQMREILQANTISSQCALRYQPHHPPLSCQAFLKLTNCPSTPFLGSPPSILVFGDPS